MTKLKETRESSKLYKPSEGENRRPDHITPFYWGQWGEPYLTKTNFYAHHLDKLEVLWRNYPNIDLNLLKPMILTEDKKLKKVVILDGLEILKKKARAKYFSFQIASELCKLDSPLLHQYENSRDCCSVLHQSGTKFTSKYCGYRWCIVCNRIRTGKYLNHYGHQLDGLKQKQFLTLTQKTVKGKKLRGKIEEMTLIFRQIYEALRKRKPKIILKGIRKTECTYNPNTNEFHPHFHCLFEGNEEFGEMIVQEWLKRNPTAKRSGQNRQTADDGSIKELFKYFSKTIHGKNENLPDYDVKKEIVNIEALDIMFQAFNGKKVIQPYMIKALENPMADLTGQSYPGIAAKEDVFTWHDAGCDWISKLESTFLTQYKPTQRDNNFSKLIQKGGILAPQKPIQPVLPPSEGEGVEAWTKVSVRGSEADFLLGWE